MFVYNAPSCGNYSSSSSSSSRRCLSAHVARHVTEKPTFYWPQSQMSTSLCILGIFRCGSQPFQCSLSLLLSLSICIWHNRTHLVVSWFRSVLRRNHICVQKAAATSLWWKKVCETLLRWVELVTNFGRAVPYERGSQREVPRGKTHLSINLCLSQKNQHTPTSRVDP